MKAHAALWHFAETEGNPYAREYAKHRKAIEVDIRTSRDSSWLKGKGGKRLRKAWFELPDATRRKLMQEIPDPDFALMSSSGVLDERCALGKRSQASKSFRADPGDVQKDLMGTDEQQREKTPDFTVLNDDTRRFKSSRLQYHEVLIKESRVMMQIAYDGGSMGGLLKSTITSVETAIQLARLKDSPSTADEAFVAVAKRVSDVFVSLKAMSRFEPEPGDGPSEEFARARIKCARDKYAAAREKLLAHENVNGDPDPPLLRASHGFFGQER